MGELIIALLAVAVGVGLLALLVVVLVGPPLRRLARQRTALSVAITQRTAALRATAAERRTGSG
ncbi:hypothetical protein [Pseudonocardia sp. TRM90224]|uniref:hypothetical protein n=1 Tax=Pseudonocardia sp. TRM90224 TaxID=2812678 RepID=UPI001E37DA69|nr:hypothetical protein [Pseudonocardia sp. TRM90224]